MTAASTHAAARIENAIRDAGFTPLGWFARAPGEDLGELTADRPIRVMTLIGNAGPEMWQRYSAERRPETQTLDAWSSAVLGELARELGARAFFPFDKPPLPFQQWAYRTGHVFRSPLGITVHPEFGLWHAYRAAFGFTEPVAIPETSGAAHPCESCADKRCLTTCPVDAFSGDGYDVPACVSHMRTKEGRDCLERGCRARRACPLGRDYIYDKGQATFHMSAFLKMFS